MSRADETRWLAGVLVAFLVLASAYAIVVPLWEAPDAIWHYEFVEHLASGGGLPSRADQGVDAPWRQEGSQPPLYYLMAAPLVRLVDTSDEAEVVRYNPHAAVGAVVPGGNVNRMVHTRREDFPWHGTGLAAHLVELVSVLLGVVAVGATWAAARSAFPQRPAVALASAGLLAFNPQFVFLSASIGNDAAVTAAGALTLWLAIEVVRNGATRSRCLWLGAAVALAALSKLSGLWLLPLAATVVALKSWRSGGVQGAVWGLAWLGIPVAGLAGWWYARNWLLFGDPTGLPVMLSVMVPREVAPSAGELLSEAAGVWKSYWAVFGWYNLPAPGWVFAAVSMVALGGGLRLAVTFVRGWRQPRWPGRLAADDWAALAVPAAATALLVGALFLWARVRYPQGRLLFPAAPALAVLIGAGWLAAVPGRRAWAAGLALCTALAGLSAWLLIAVVGPAYASSGGASGSGWTGSVPAPAQEEACPSAVDESLGGTFRLRVLGPCVGDSEVAREVRPGEALSVDLLWAPLRRTSVDYSVFLHVVDENGLIVAHRESYPGSGNAATSDWVPASSSGSAQGWYLDRQLVAVPAVAEAPCHCHLVVGMYDAATGERLRTASGADELYLGPVQIQSGSAAFGQASALDVSFGDDIHLVGLQVSRRAVAPGGKIHVTLYWQAVRTPARDYKVSIQARRGNAETWGQTDEEPDDSRRPTSSWHAGELIEDRHSLVLSPDAPLGDYEVFVKLYDVSAKRSLPVDYHAGELSLGGLWVTDEPQP